MMDGIRPFKATNNRRDNKLSVVGIGVGIEPDDSNELNHKTPRILST